MKDIITSEVIIFTYLYTLAYPVYKVIFNEYGIVTPALLIGIPLLAITVELCEDYRKMKQN